MKKGQVIKFTPGYHTKNPYYAMIKSWNGEVLVTSIPGHHDLDIYTGSYEWHYHIPRMSIIGHIDNALDEKLLHNQKLD